MNSELTAGLLLVGASGLLLLLGRSTGRPWLSQAGFAIAPVAIERTVTGLLATSTWSA